MPNERKAELKTKVCWIHREYENRKPITTITTLIAANSEPQNHHKTTKHTVNNCGTTVTAKRATQMFSLTYLLIAKK